VDFHHRMMLGTREPKQHFGSFPEDEVRPCLDGEGEHPTLEYRMHAEADVLQELCSLRAGQQQRPWFILGDPGSGKSELLNHWFTLWAGKFETLRLGTLLPVLVQLRDVKSDDLSGSGEALGDRFWSLGLRSRAVLPPEASKAYEAAFRRLFWPVWLLDGLDEVEAEVLSPLLQAILNLPGAGKLVTCRTAPYQQVLGKAKIYAGPGKAYAEREYEILSLTAEEREQFLAQAFAGDEFRARQLVRKLWTSSPLRSLSSNRFILSLIAGMSQRRELPQTRTAFLRVVIEEIWISKLTRPEEWDLSLLRDRVLTQAVRAPGCSSAGGDWQQVIRISEEAAPPQAALLRAALARSGLLHVNRRLGKYRFALPLIGEFYGFCALREEGLASALERRWDNPGAAEALSLLVSNLFQDARAQELDAALDEFIAGWLESHRRDPQQLWQKRRSPIRLILRLLAESGVPFGELAKVKRRLFDMANTSFSCRVAFASDPSSPADLLTHLTQGSEVAVRRAVADNPSAPLDALALLTGDTDAEVRRATARNAATPVSCRRTLASDSDEFVRLMVALSRGTPDDVLLGMARDQATSVRLILPQHPGIPPEALDILAEDSIPQVGICALQNPRVPQQSLVRLARHPELALRCLVANHSNLPSSAAIHLARDPNERVRQCVAANRHSPTLALYLLALDPNPWVRQKVAWNEAASPDLLVKLGRDPEVAVRQVVASNPQTPQTVVRNLENDTTIRQRPVYIRTPWPVLGDATTYAASTKQAGFPPPAFPPPWVPPPVGAPTGAGSMAEQAPERLPLAERINIAANTATSTATLRLLAQDPEERVRANVATHDATDEQTLALLAKDTARDVRLAVARRTGTPAESLALLATDADAAVRTAASINPAALVEDLCTFV
jgi:hypothetical protein